MDLKDYREQIDRIDRTLLENLQERMRVAEGIAKYKLEHGMRVFDPVRERQKIEKLRWDSDEDLAYYNKILFTTIMEMRKDHQHKFLHEETETVHRIRDALRYSPKVFPRRAKVACQGVEGAYSQQACDRFFSMPQISYQKNFRGVFQAIQKGECDYGVLPIENSTAGSVNAVYDLMMEYHFNIVRSVRVKINHSLLAKPGTRKENIREIFSHPQAIAQCEEYLKKFPGAVVTEVENTAVAAKKVAESDRPDVAAIGSEINGELYGLRTLESEIQDNGNNYTRFICISRELEIYPGADRTSIMLVVGHTPGCLYQVLSHFNAMGINLLKLESRPIPSSNFEFMFYFDIEEPVYADEFPRLMNQLEQMSVDFRYLGSYSELA